MAVPSEAPSCPPKLEKRRRKSVGWRKGRDSTGIRRSSGVCLTNN